jgi:hypothetical protein
MVAGREVQRDRDGEFSATGPVAGLLARAAGVGRQLELDVAEAVASSPLRGDPRRRFSARIGR